LGTFIANLHGEKVLRFAIGRKNGAFIHSLFQVYFRMRSSRTMVTGRKKSAVIPLRIGVTYRLINQGKPLAGIYFGGLKKGEKNF